MIRKIKIKNYKIFDKFELNLNNDLNIIVGDNEAGKSTILEAINLALTRTLNGRFIDSELSPFLFNYKTMESFLKDSNNGKRPKLPEIFIELYLESKPEFAELRGTINSRKENCCGVRLEVIFDDDFKGEYEALLDEGMGLIPIEFYKVNWKSFADHPLTTRSIKIGNTFIDATTIKLQSGTDYYLQNIINQGLDKKERVALTVAYRRLKEDFASKDSIGAINRNLDNSKGKITDKNLAIKLDVSQKSSWETNLVPHLDELPFQYSGKGEQSSLKIMLALDKKVEETNIILIEEPENHQSFSSMNKLLNKVIAKCEDKQIIVSTHDSYVLNKLGMDKLILLRGTKSTRFKKLSTDTQDYFQKLAGYDTLRLILSKKAFLVEGASDELLVQKAYEMKYNKLPINEGIDVISVRGLSFKRFLDISKELGIDTHVVTDNDKDYKVNVEKKYKKYSKSKNIKLFYSKNNALPNIEAQLISANRLSVLNLILNRSFKNKKEVLSFMKKNKTNSALKFFTTKSVFEIPTYINNAIAKK